MKEHFTKSIENDLVDFDPGSDSDDDNTNPNKSSRTNDNKASFTASSTYCMIKSSMNHVLRTKVREFTPQSMQLQLSDLNLKDIIMTKLYMRLVSDKVDQTPTSLLLIIHEFKPCHWTKYLFMNEICFDLNDRPLYKNSLET